MVTFSWPSGHDIKKKVRTAAASEELVGDEAVSHAFHNGSRAVRNVQFVKQALQIFLHRSQATTHTSTDFLVAETFGKEVQEL